MELKSFKSFLENVPPGSLVPIKNLVPTYSRSFQGGVERFCMDAPDISIFCSSDDCGGVRVFEADSDIELRTEEENIYLEYECKNCGKSRKVYSLFFQMSAEEDCWVVKKYGEEPAFGPPIPSRLSKLIGGDRELFLKGRRCESQGMGVGAFVYYRRIIESQKIRIFDDLIRVVNKVSPNDELVGQLEAAKNETQFTKAVELIKSALPQSLSINGHSPLTLLHSALSEGVHSHTDEECLELASSIRVVLFEFTERLANALKEEAELNQAVSKLMAKRSKVALP